MKSTHVSSFSSLAERPTQRLPLPAREASVSSRGWTLLPQRLFLGGTFVYAGLQKITDPQFFHKATPGYIGNQIIGFAHSSPLHLLLIKVVLPHAVLFGWTVALGELAIGLGTLVGLLFRPAAFFGILLSLLFFLTASWNVYPYFYGADIVFACCRLTLLLVGPVGTGLPALDGWLQRRIFPDGLAKFSFIVRMCAVLLLGMNSWGGSVASFPLQETYRQREKRRSFLRGLAIGGVSVGGFALASSFLHIFGRPTPMGANISASAGGSSSGAGTVIAQVQSVPENSAVSFTVPSTGDPGVLIHLANQQFVAFDATCTHAGCEVGYDPEHRCLTCLCHGAQFDPAHQARVLNGPASLPLTALTIHLDQTGGTVVLD
ncbi:MAG TPA: TQO small subunit DoxD [Ktedonobacteraceae bacterium]|nr:TQO small subunit DoxD [Ktedonobacteraceae bacterium]